MILKIEDERNHILSIRKNFENSKKPGVSIIVPTNKIKYAANIFKNYARCNYKNKELIIILNNNKLNIDDYSEMAEKYENIAIYKLDEKISLGYCMNYGVEISKYNYIAKMDDDDYYASNYILDAVNIFRCVDADIVGKASYFIYYEKYNSIGIMYPNASNVYSRYIAGSTLMIKKKVFEKVKFRNLSIAEDANFLKDCVEEKIKIYSGDKYNYIYVRHKELKEHTWKIESKDLYKISKNLRYTDDILKITIV